MIYDYIVIGAGIGGLSAGLNLAVNNRKVLLLEKNSLPGGLVTTFKRGRFEFDVSLYDLYNYGDENHVGVIQRLFKKFGLNIEPQVIPFNTRIKALDEKEDFDIKGDFEEMAALLEELHNGSLESIKEFIRITKEVHDALGEIEKGNTDLENDYPNFYKFVDKNASDALTALKMPKETINRLSYLWIELGSPLNKLSFIDFAEFMYKIIFKKVTYLPSGSLDLTIKMVKKFQNKGGKIYYNSYVIEIKEEKDYISVLTKDGKEYKAKHIICNPSSRYALKNLIKNPDKEALRRENARTLSTNGVVVYLGLNASHEELNLNYYKYYQFNTLDSKENVKKMVNFNHNTWEAIVPNVVNEEISPRNTTILILKTSYFGDPFAKVSKDNYYRTKMDIADGLIKQFEEAFDLDIKEYIEEIEVATPYTISRFTNNENGNMLGYRRLGYDNSINRLLNYEEECLPNISFVGGSSIFGGGVDNAFYSGYYITNKLLERSEIDGE
ncbi:MAG: FAD-dependent oxidoreductase [Ruminococcus sp.]|nr:FAD-dependent oxidoreductase [Ruminococcus sp.]